MECECHDMTHVCVTQRCRRTRTEPADRLTRPDNFCVVGRCFAPRWPLVSVNSAYNYVYGQQFN